jgi:U2-associated protein SR140
VKKSKREKEKEAADAKRKMEEEHAAKAYAEFLDAFDADDGAPARRNAKSRTFVRSSRDSGTAYAPSGPSPRSEVHSRSMRAFEQSKVCCPITESGHPYMTAVSVSSSCAEAERQTRYGCLLRRDQEVRPELHNTRVRHSYHSVVKGSGRPRGSIF